MGIECKQSAREYNDTKAKGRFVAFFSCLNECISRREWIAARTRKSTYTYRSVSSRITSLIFFLVSSHWPYTFLYKRAAHSHSFICSFSTPHHPFLSLNFLFLTATSTFTFLYPHTLTPHYFHNTMCGIFAYLNYLTEVDRQTIADILTNGLKRLEYRGYDSAGKLSFLSLSACASASWFIAMSQRNMFPGHAYQGANRETVE